jgi:hypothetical protein
MKRRLYYYSLTIVVLAVFLGLFGWFTESSSIRWVAPAFGLALIAVGLGVNSLIIALHTERRMTEMGAALARIEGLQEEIQKEQKEQSEQKSSGSQIIPTLEVFSRFYLDYLNKQKGEDKK